MPRTAEVARDLSFLAQNYGVHMPEAAAYATPEFKRNFSLAMDAQPSLVTTSNGGIPAFLTTFIDPDIIDVLVSPNKAAEIFGEVQKGTWLDETAMFPMIERTGEVSSYGDYSENGSASANTNFPQRQSYLYQTMKEYGELEMERAGLARIAWAAEIDKAAIMTLNKFQNLTYFFGVAGLQNYGLLNDPSLSAALTPSTKTAGGARWITAGGAINGTANEIFADIQALFIKLVQQSNGLIEMSDALTLAMSPQSEVGLSSTNIYGLTVKDMMSKVFPGITVKTAVQYGALTASNPQGVAAGETVQMIATSVEGQRTGYCAFNEKLRAHPIIRQTSSFKQKQTQGTFGAIVRQPFAIAQMIGV